MADPFIGEIKMTAFGFAPRSWAFCNGQLLLISQNTALFALLGTTYGGNGTTTFGLPNLQDRTPVHTGPSITLGQTGGATSHTLTPEQAAHTHALRASANQASTSAPGGNVLASKRRGGTDTYHTSGNIPLAASSVSETTGGNQPHDNIQPSLGLNFIIALQGIFPSRN